MEKLDIEQVKKGVSTWCCLDFNGALGRNLEEKLQVVYVTLVRMQYITRKASGLLPDVLLVQPVVNAMFEITGVLDTTYQRSGVGEHKNTGRVWDKWHVYIDEDSYVEHHIMMTNLQDGSFSLDPKYWCKVSLLNLVMSNNFGYFNMDC